MRTCPTLPALALLAPLGAAQTMATHSPFFALSTNNSNNIYPFGTGSMHYMQAYDGDTFNTRTTIVNKGIRFRPTTDPRFNFTNRSGRTVDVLVKIGLAATGITSANLSMTFDKNFDSKTVKTVISRKKISYPNSGPTRESLRIFKINLPFDSPQFFLYLPPANRTLILEVRQYSTSGGGYPFDFWSSNTSPGWLLQNGSYKGCGATQPVTQDSDATMLFVGSTSASIRGNGHAPKAVSVLSLGSQTLNLKLPGTSCILVNDPGILVVGIASSTQPGTFAVSFPIPNDLKLIRATFLSQMIFLDPKANALGITTSRGLVNGIGRGSHSGGLLGRLWLSGNPDGPTAGFFRRNGLVTMFHN